MSPAPRLAALVAAVALATLLVGPVVGALAAVALLAASLTDSLAVRRPPWVRRQAPGIVARGVPSVFGIEQEDGRARQPLPPDVSIADGSLVARRRGRHVLPPVVVRRTGPLGLGRWDHTVGDAAEVLSYPDLPTARRLALAVRQGRLREPGQRPRGPLGLGTEFESIRDYEPDDDIRQVNWAATVRLGRPMSNQYRIEQDRDVICVLDCGRLMAAPLADGATRLDAAVDAATAVGLVADELGDRCGTLAFDAALRRRVSPRRRGGAALVRAVFDLQPNALDSDYELAFRHVTSSKRALVIVFTDLIEEVAARSLVEAVPILARRHEVVVAGVIDPDLDVMLRLAPARELDVYRAAAALEVLVARERAAARVRAAGAHVLETAPGLLGEACVAAYLRAKSRSRL